MQHTLTITTNQRDQAVDITGVINQALAQKGIKQGLCHILVPHTTAAITVNEGYDPHVMVDALHILNRMAPWNDDDYTHREGNSAAHLKSMVVGVQTTLGIEDGQLLLGQWQKVFFLEFDGPRTRQVFLNFLDNLG